MLQGQMDSVSLLQGVLTKFVMMFIQMKMDVFRCFLWGYMSSFFSFETESRWESDANPKAPTRAFYLPWAFATFCRRSFWQHYPDFSTQNTSLLELKSRSLITRNPSRDYYSLPPWLKSRGKSSIIFLWLLSNEYVVQSANHKMSFSQPSKTKKENPSQPNII